RYIVDYGHQDVYTWIKDYFPKFMDETDILVTPLAENRYTKCKSNIKFLEGSSAGKPGVWQNIRQYAETVDGENGLLANRAEDWYKQIKLLIDNPKLREEMGKKAFKTVEDEWQIQKNVNLY